jgi:hypothetical protein
MARNGSNIVTRVSTPTDPRRGWPRLGLVALLLLAGFFAALPWLGCVGSHPLGILAGIFNDGAFMLRVCTFGIVQLPSERGIPGFAGPYYGFLVFGVLFVIAALFAALTKRSL